MAKRKDLNQTAFDLVQRATGQAPKQEDKRTPYQKAAAAFGRAGGLKGGPARKKALKAVQRKRIAKKAARARWG
jgi:hypothetical protein